MYYLPTFPVKQRHMWVNIPHMDGMGCMININIYTCINLHLYISASITYNISFVVKAKQVRPTPWKKKNKKKHSPEIPQRRISLNNFEATKSARLFKTSYQGQINKSKLDFQHIYWYLKHDDWYSFV